jgi:hypothetical protein
MMDLTSNRRQSSRYWIVIVLIAIVVHLMVIFGIKDQHLGIFRKSIDDRIESSSRPASFPDAIVAVTVDVEGDEPLPVTIETPPKEYVDAPVIDVERQGENEEASEDIVDILGEAAAPLPSRPSTSGVVIPPRPVEITWPETRNLGHCLGRHVDVRIQVSESGEILVAEPVGGEIPDDCAEAALKAARRIVFTPGTRDGRPTAMWTEIRIDFRRQSR